MATLRGTASTYSVGNVPPQIIWTIVRGDTASFRVYVTDDNRVALNVPDWTIEMQIRRNGILALEVTPTVTELDDEGEFTVSLLASETQILQTGDTFDIQMSDETRVWTVAQGSLSVIEDITK